MPYKMIKVKLTEDNVREIRQLRTLGWSYEKIRQAISADVTRQTIAMVCRGEIWKNVSDRGEDQ